MSDESWNSIFREIWNKWSDTIYRFCLYKLGGDSARAEDCMQNTFITLYESQDKLTDMSGVQAWLFRVANNFILKEYRQIKRSEKQVPYEDAENEPAIAYEISVSEKITDEQLAALRKQLIASLEKSDRQLLENLYVKKKSIRETAHELGVTESAIYKRRAALIDKVKLLAIFFTENM